MTHGSCDGCSRNTEVRDLHLPEHQVLTLCKSCWAKEMKWRKLRNQELDPRAKFPILGWPYAISKGVTW
jgi:hypothetical protein